MKKTLFIFGMAGMLGLVACGGGDLQSVCEDSLERVCEVQVRCQKDSTYTVEQCVHKSKGTVCDMNTIQREEEFCKKNGKSIDTDDYEKCVDYYVSLKCESLSSAPQCALELKCT
jgi:hypothetical protein